MDSGVPIQITAIIILIVLSAFFSSAETAMTTVNKIRIHSLAEQGNRRAVTLEKVIADTGKLLTTVLIGNNIVNISTSSLVTTLTIRVFGNIYVGIATGILTLVILLFGEITPKTLATLHNEKLALAYARPIFFLMIVLTPIVYVVGKLAAGIMFLLRVDPDAKPQQMTEHELRTLVNVGQEAGVIEN